MTLTAVTQGFPLGDTRVPGSSVPTFVHDTVPLPQHKGPHTFPVCAGLILGGLGGLELKAPLGKGDSRLGTSELFLCSSPDYVTCLVVPCWKRMNCSFQEGEVVASSGGVKVCEGHIDK